MAVQRLTARYRGAPPPTRPPRPRRAATLWTRRCSATTRSPPCASTSATTSASTECFTDGGTKPNIVPATAAAEWYVRSTNLATLGPLKERVVACLQAGADAAGCTVEIEWIDHAYADMNDNPALLDSYLANLAAVGREPSSDPDARVVGSTDMGNVSYAAPSIHPMIKVAPDDVPIHTPAFAEHAVGPRGRRGRHRRRQGPWP